MAKNIVQKILDSTDVDEKVLAEVGKLSGKARAELVKYDSRQVYKALAAGAVVGGVAGFLLKAWVF
jgi:hypothetical protein